LLLYLLYTLLHCTFIYIYSIVVIIWHCYIYYFIFIWLIHWYIWPHWYMLTLYFIVGVIWSLQYDLFFTFTHLKSNRLLVTFAFLIRCRFDFTLQVGFHPVRYMVNVLDFDLFRLHLCWEILDNTIWSWICYDYSLFGASYWNRLDRWTAGMESCRFHLESHLGGLRWIHVCVILDGLGPSFIYIIHLLTLTSFDHDRLVISLWWLV